MFYQGVFDWKSSVENLFSYHFFFPEMVPNLKLCLWIFQVKQFYSMNITIVFRWAYGWMNRVSIWVRFQLKILSKRFLLSPKVLWKSLQVFVSVHCEAINSIARHHGFCSSLGGIETVLKFCRAFLQKTFRTSRVLFEIVSEDHYKSKI